MGIQNFSWVIPGILAGCALPGKDSKDVLSDLRDLKDKGIRHLVSLTGLKDEAVFIKHCFDLGLEHTYYPIPDFDTPAYNQGFRDFIEKILGLVKAKEPVCLHCHAGNGRTGLILCCVIGAHEGLKAEEAVKRVKSIRPYSVENSQQYYFVEKFLANYKKI